MKRFRISGIEELLRKEGMNEMKTEEECGWIEKISTISKKEEFIRFLEDLSSDYQQHFRFLYKGIIIKHNKTEPTYTKTSLFLCEKRRFFMARTEKGVVTTI